MPVLRAKVQERDTHRVTATVTPEFHAELEQLKKDAAAAGMEFPQNEVIVSALTKAVRAARKELDEMAAKQQQTAGAA